MKKLKEIKERTNVMLYPSVKERAKKKANIVAKRKGVKEVSFSKFIEIAINDYNAE